MQDSIPNVDRSLIFSRQYKFPLFHKEEISRQVDKLLKNKIIKPLESQYGLVPPIIPSRENKMETDS